jgi:hypothetical protein
MHGRRSSTEGAVKVYARFRPLKKTETRATNITIDETSIRMPQSITASPLMHQRRLSNLGSEHTFPLTRVFQEHDTQESLYQHMCHDMVDSIHDGYNGTIIAYGQTGSGKTYSMFGTDHHPGIVPRFLRQMWEQLDDTTALVATLQFVEIYNEQIHDLLDHKHTSDPKIRERIDSRDFKIIFVQGASRKIVKDPEEALHCIHQGLKSRAVAETKMNDHSSRSHAVIIMNFDILYNDGTHYTPAVHFVDLAGSENINMSGATGLTQKEAMNINRSLSTLSLVIRKLKEGDTHIPYRDSKLTRMLTNSLGGSAKVAFLINVNAAEKHIRETARSLKLGMDATVMPNSMVEVRAESMEDLKRKIQSQKEVVDEQTLIIESLEAEIERQYQLSYSERSDLDNDDDDDGDETPFARMNAHCRRNSFVPTGVTDEHGRPLLTIETKSETPVEAEEEEEEEDENKETRITDSINRDLLQRQRDEFKHLQEDWDAARDNLEDQRDELVNQLAVMQGRIIEQKNQREQEQEQQLSREQEQSQRDTDETGKSVGYIVNSIASALLLLAMIFAMYKKISIKWIILLVILWIVSIVLWIWLW